MWVFEESSGRVLSRVPAAVMVSIAAGLVLLTWIGRAEVYNPDEPREVEMAREMYVSGDLAIPRLNDEPFLEKPPLFYWLVSGAYRVAGGPSVTAARAVPAIAGALTVLLTFFLARTMTDEKTAVLAALVLLTSVLFFYTARRTMIDMPLVLATTAAAFGLHRGLTGTGRGSHWWILLGSAGLAAAVMFKGIVGAGMPGLAALGWIAARRRWKAIPVLAAGALAALAPVAVWCWILFRRLGESAVHEFVFTNNVLRFTGGAEKGHENPIWYYLPRLVIDMAPWCVVLPFAVAAALASVRRKRAAERDLLLWLGLPLAVLTLASTKRGIYLLPLYPPAAILIAQWLMTIGDPVLHDGVGGRTPGRRAGPWLLLGSAFLLTIIVVGAGIMASPGRTAVPFIVAALVSIPLALSWRALRARDGERQGLHVALVAVVCLLASMSWVVPSIVNNQVSMRLAGEALDAMANAGDRIAFYNLRQGQMGGFLFYSERTYPHARTSEEVEEHLSDAPATEGGRPLILLKAEDVESLSSTLPFPLVEVRRFALGWEQGASHHKKTFILATRGPA